MWTKAQIRQYISNIKKVAVFNTNGSKVIEVAFPKRGRTKWERETYDLAKSHLECMRLAENQAKIINDFYKLLAALNDESTPFDDKVKLMKGLLNVR